jgi:hypothetical protein
MLGIPQRVLLAALAFVATGAPLHAQTDWYNTDRGRPLRIEDALVMERHAIEWQIAPLSFSRRGGVSSWEVEPEFAWGVLPRTSLEIGVPIESRATFGGNALVAARGVEVGLLHALNAETRLFPGLAIGVDALMPAGGRRAEQVHGAVTLIATRTARLGRAHLNVTQHVGPRDDARAEVPLWRAGLAVDRPIPLRSMLLAAEVFAEEPLAGGDVAWTAGTGLRWQLAPRLAFDAGLARTMSGPRRGWTVTVGHALAFAIPYLQPTGGR